MFGWAKRRRARLRAAAFPEQWRLMLRQTFPLYARLPEQARRELEGHTQVFLAEKHFEGAGGLNMSDEIRVVIAAQACLLLLGRETDYFPRMRSIVVYPETFIAQHTEVEAGVVTEGAEPRLGESWELGAVVLSWADVRAGARYGDGHNVVLHEFAHQLDLEGGDVDGVPALGGDDGERWADVFRAEFRALQAATRAGEPTLLDPYGASHPAEFFAVVTEAFFEQPRQMKTEHPALYQELRKFFRQDPAAWPASDV